jgi:hypothetical protein
MEDTTVRFDMNEEIYAAVIESLDNSGNFQWIKDNSEFWAYKGSDKRYSLRQLIVATAYGMPIEEINSKCYITNINSDKLDCRLSNLNVEFPTKVTHDNNRIFIRKANATAFADYSDKLHEILSSITWYYHKGDNEFFTYDDRGRKLLLHHVCYVVYHNNCTVDNVFEHSSLLKERVEYERLTIDHKNTNHDDHRQVNLELMPRWLNAKKRDITKRLQPHQFYNPTLAGESCGRIDYKTNNGAKLAALINKSPVYDITVLPTEVDIETRIDNMRNLAKTDSLPVEAKTTKLSYLQYTRAFLKVVGEFIKNYEIKKTEELLNGAE